MRVVVLLLALAVGCAEEKKPKADGAVLLPDAAGRSCGDAGVHGWRALSTGAAQTVDGGAERPNLNGIWGESDKAIFAVGSLGKALRFDGKDWREEATPTKETLLAVHGTSARDVWAVGEHGAVVHWNGQAWEDRAPPLDVFRVAQDAAPPKGDAAVAARRRLHGVWAAGDATKGTDTLWVVGERGLVLTRKSNLWSRITTDVEDHLNGVWGTGPGKVYVAGEFGTILVGPPFAKQTTGSAKALKGIWGRSDGDVWAVGLSGTVLHLTAGAWSAVSGAPKQTLHALWGPPNDSSTVFIVGLDGTLLKLTSGKFRSYDCVTARRLNAIWGTLVAAASDAGAPAGDGAGKPVPALWVVGASGTILAGP